MSKRVIGGKLRKDVYIVCIYNVKYIDVRSTAADPTVRGSGEELVNKK